VHDRCRLAVVGFVLLISASTAQIVETASMPWATNQPEPVSTSRDRVVSKGDGIMDATGGTSSHSVPLKALVLCTVAGLSFPIGAILGIFASPVNDSTCAGMLAFGAGALLFAVTVELYGEALRELAETNGEHKEELFIVIVGAGIGALFFLQLNKRIHQAMIGDTHSQPGSPRVVNATSSEVIPSVRSFQRVISPELREEVDKKAEQVAISLFMGLVVEGIPEGVLMGILAAEDHLSTVFIVSLFVSNFPEAFAASSLLCQARWSTPAIVGMWTALCLIIGVLGGISSWALLAVYPSYGQEGVHLPVLMRTGVALVEGITGGVIIACISSVMLPEAFERTDSSGNLLMSSGFQCTCGFLLAVALKVWEVA